MVPTRFYFSNAVGAVDYVPRTYVYLHWTGAPLTSVEFRALYVHVRNLLRRHQLKAILADHQAMPEAPDEADRAWLLEQWLPETIAETSLARYAALPTPDPGHRLHTETVLDGLRRHLHVAVFDDLDQASAWLREA
ncbi:NhaA family Na+:H+ antiporter [Hymenobacter luteus]|uniref:NhaA family Na+:H+ antiporter n=2 Tax=Hymenobacter TaxID=89966 RepID=A0A7W9T629_9BACT|nr:MULTISPECIES: hypothetical protein [Hymenobacter]MBB4603718.1 NhaA family Na+:H+ antiporter [Hymenobacter latericoloratus]MBB6061499.1 NhaA family Na+:H+ antiporter [Hymenobacter luteus]